MTLRLSEFFDRKNCPIWLKIIKFSQSFKIMNFFIQILLMPLVHIFLTLFKISFDLVEKKKSYTSNMVKVEFVQIEVIDLQWRAWVAKWNRFFHWNRSAGSKLKYLFKIFWETYVYNTGIDHLKNLQKICSRSVGKIGSKKVIYFATHARIFFQKGEKS